MMWPRPRCISGGCRSTFKPPQPSVAVCNATAGRDNAFERAVHALLYAQDMRYRIHYPLPGLKRTTSDIAFPGLKIAVFVEGCIWHSDRIRSLSAPN